VEDKELLKKIEKAKKYSSELDRFKIINFTVQMNSEHDNRIINYDSEIGYKCTCDFYMKRKTCSHIIAIEKILAKLKI